MRQILLFIVIILMSCSSSPLQYKYTYTDNRVFDRASKFTIPIYIDKNFTTDDKLSLDNSINQWNYVLNQQIILKAVDYEFDMQPTLIAKAQQEGAFFFLKIDSKTPGIPDSMPEEQCRRTKDCLFTLAWADTIGGHTVKVVRDRIATSDDLQYIMLHEIGHLLRLTHTTDKNALMFRAYSKFGYLCIDYDAASRVAEAYSLDIHTMNYCINKY